MEHREKGRDLKVYIRLLPSLYISREKVKFNLDTNTIYIRCRDAITQKVSGSPKSPRFWSFQPDGVFYCAPQRDIYDTVTDGILENSINNGTDAVILAFGQVGSGKTFTMMGVHKKFSQQGLIPRFISEVIESSHRRDMRVRCDISFLEIIGQEITDLFSGKHLRLEDMRNAPTVQLTSRNSSLARLFRAENRRKVAGNINFGNRGHGIITFHIRMLDLLESDAKYRLVKVHFVDLAGVDSFGETEESGKEASDIGRSNITKSFLDQCLCHLEKPPVHVVSDLVIRFLGKSLSEDSLLRFIGHVKMSLPDLTVSLSLLRFGARIAGMKVDKKTRDPSLPSGRGNLETLKSITAQMQLEAMLRGYSDYEGSVRRVCDERVSTMVSKVYEYLDRESVEDVLIQKKNESNNELAIPAEHMDIYDAPIPTDFDYENDPRFNFRLYYQDESSRKNLGSRSNMGSQSTFASRSTFGSRPAATSKPVINSRSIVGSKSNVASRSNVGSRSRIDSPQRRASRGPVESQIRNKLTESPPLDTQYKSGSLLQDFKTLEIARVVAMQLEEDTTPCKEEVIHLFENKLDRENRALEDLYRRSPMSASSRSGSVATPVTTPVNNPMTTRKSILKGSASRGNIRKTSSRKNLKASDSLIMRRGPSKNSIQALTPLEKKSPPPTPPLRNFDACGVTIGPGSHRPFNGRLVDLAKLARAAEPGRCRILKNQVEMLKMGSKSNSYRSNRSKSNSDKINGSDSGIRRQMIPIVPTSSRASINNEELIAKKQLQKELDDANLEAAKTRAEYFNATRKLEWCRYQWFRANSGLKEVQENNLLKGFEHQGSGHVVTDSREIRLAEFIKAKKVEFYAIHKNLLAHRDALIKAKNRVERAQKKWDASSIEIDIRRPDMSEYIFDDDMDNPPKMSAL